MAVMVNKSSRVPRAADSRARRLLHQANDCVGVATARSSSRKGRSTTPSLHHFPRRHPLGGPVRPHRAGQSSTSRRPAGSAPTRQTRRRVRYRPPRPPGPAIAIETGIRASDTKKSRLDTRPSRAAGTRRCSRVPHSTWAPEKMNPQVNSAITITQSWFVKPMIASRNAANTPGQDHQRQVAPWHPGRRDHQRADRPADPEGTQRKGESPCTAARLVLDREWQEDLDGSP